MSTSSLAGLGDVEVRVAVIIGRTEITFEDAVNLDVKSMLAVGKMANDPVELAVNGKIVARGKLVVVEGNYGVQITEIVDSSRG